MIFSSERYGTYGYNLENKHRMAKYLKETNC